MHPALTGLLLGLGIGVALVLAEYYFVKKAVAQRATPSNPHPKFEPSDNMRVRSVFTFSLFLPPGFALGAWLLDRFLS